MEKLEKSQQVPEMAVEELLTKIDAGEPGLFEFSDVVQSNRPAWFYRGVSLGSGP